MANNRMYLVCRKCRPAEHPGSIERTVPPQAAFYLAKYYPSSGWYTGGIDSERLNEWLEKHRHAEGQVIEGRGFMGPWEKGRRYGSMDGNEHIELAYEISKKESTIMGEPDAKAD